MELDKIKTIEQVYLILIFLAPGLIVLFVRSLFVTGRRPKTIEYAVEYIIVSIVYFAVFLPFVELVLATREPLWLRAAMWLLLLVIVPSLIGLLLGAGTQKGWWRQLSAKLGLLLVSPYPTGWDWIFSRLREPVYLLVTLDDGAVVAGYFGLDSLTSSDPNERDVYIEELYDIDDDGKWIKRSERQGILIFAQRIKHIEIWRAPTTEKVNV